MGRSQAPTVFNIHNYIEKDLTEPPPPGSVTVHSVKLQGLTHTSYFTKGAVAALACRGQFSSVTAFVVKVHTFRGRVGSMVSRLRGIVGPVLQFKINSV